MDKKSRIFVAGHQGLVGSSIVRKLQEKGYENLLLVPRSQLDLINQSAVYHLFAREKIDYVFLAAARVGGIQCNRTYPANFIFENLSIACNVIHAAAQAQVKKLLFLGSSCIYPKMAPQPIKEEYLLTGELEPTNEAYALAKIAGLKLCQYYYQQYGCKFISAMPTNLYGPNDNFDPNSSHVLPALLRRFHEAKVQNQKQVVVWGSGKPMREFLHTDDLANALLIMMEKHDSPQIINVGSGTDVTIKQLAETVARVVGYKGKVVFDATKPDGTPRKLLDISRIVEMGWQPTISLQDGIQETYRWAQKSGAFEMERRALTLPLLQTSTP